MAGVNPETPLKPTDFNIPASLSPEKIYLFEQFGRKLLVDRSSGLPCTISPTAWTILSAWRQQADPRVTFQELAPEEIGRAIREITELVETGSLGGPEPEAGESATCPTGVLSVLLNITHNCNLACGYCIMEMPALESGYHAPRRSMEAATAFQTVDFIRTVSLPDTVLTFFGGEPLLEFPTIQQVVEYAEAHYPGWFQYQLITNGTLLKPEMFDFIKQHDIRLLFSIDGPQELHDRLRVYKAGGRSVFADAFANLQSFRDAFPDSGYQLNITYLKPTMDLFASLNYFLAEGIPHARFDRGLVPQESPYAVTMAEIPYVKGQFTQMAQHYLEQLLAGRVSVLDPFVLFMRRIAKRSQRYRVCNLGMDTLIIAYNGDIYSCYKLLGIESLRLGNVWEGFSSDGRQDLWNHTVLQRPRCRNCWAKFLCGGGCISDNYHLKGDFFDPVEENCAIMRHNIRLSLWLYYELAERQPSILKELLGEDYLLFEDVPLQVADNLEVLEPGMVRNRHSGGIYQLNAAAGEIFARCDGRHTIAQLATFLQDTYGISATLAQEDVRTQVMRLMAAGLVSI